MVGEGGRRERKFQEVQGDGEGGCVGRKTKKRALVVKGQSWDICFEGQSQSKSAKRNKTLEREMRMERMIKADK